MSKKILVADDSVVIQKSIGITFAQEDFEVKFVSNGEDAFEACSSFEPNVILADVTMPKLGGIELTRKLRGISEGQSIPILLLAGARDNMDTQKAQACGATDVVQKPFDSNELLEKVNLVLSSSPVHITLPDNDIEESPMQTAEDEVFIGGKISLDDDNEDGIGNFDDIKLDVEMPSQSPSEQPKTDSSFHAFNMEGSEEDEESINLSKMPADAYDSAENVIDSVKPVNHQGDGDVFKTEIHYKDISGEHAHSEDMEDDDAKEEKIDMEDFGMEVTPDLEKDDISAPQMIEDSPSQEDDEQDAAHIAPSRAKEVQLSEEQIENIVTRVFQNVIERIAWEVVPDLAERIIKEEIQRLTGEEQQSD